MALVVLDKSKNVHFRHKSWKKKDEEKRIIYVCALVFGQFPLQTTCKAMSTMIMYFFIVSFIWLFLEALNIYLELVVLFHSLRKFAKHFYVIWGKWRHGLSWPLVNMPRWMVFGCHALQSHPSTKACKSVRESIVNFPNAPCCSKSF